jgi:hypothetical protein
MDEFLFKKDFDLSVSLAKKEEEARRFFGYNKGIWIFKRNAEVPCLTPTSAGGPGSEVVF